LTIQFILTFNLIKTIDIKERMKLVFTILTILLAAVYLFVGVNKLTPLVHKETHEMLVV